MVFFVCDVCNETLKKNQVDKHTYKCACHSVSCVDCSQSFHGNDYAAHLSCISEAEKYEKSIHVKKDKNKSAQEEWMEMIADLPTSEMLAKAPNHIQNNLCKLCTLGNVPRNQKKFFNFVKNSVVKQESIIHELWGFLEKYRSSLVSDGNPSDDTINLKRKGEAETEGQSLKKKCSVESKVNDEGKNVCSEIVEKNVTEILEDKAHKERKQKKGPKEKKEKKEKSKDKKDKKSKKEKKKKEKEKEKEKV